MLKFFVLFSLALAFTASRHTASNYHKPSSYRKLPNVIELIASNGYPVRNYTVTTPDGYLLDLIRIPYGCNFRKSLNRNQNQQYQSEIHQRQHSAEVSQYQWKNQKPNHYHSEEDFESASSSSSSEEVLCPAVLLMHGLMSNAEDFVLGGPTQGLAYILANNGYDVFIGNARGSKYGRKHTVLDPDRDAAFWRFCWDDIGTKDLPAVIDQILELVQQQKLYYVGHMQGSTVFYVMASEKPEYSEKIHAMISLGPVAFMGHSTNILLKLVSEKQYSKGWVIRHLGENELDLSRELIAESGASDCITQGNDEQICENVFFLLSGYNSRDLNVTTMTSVMNRMPFGSSSKQILHFGQLIKSGRFAKYSVGDDPTEDYDLSKITAPIGIFYTPHDSKSSMTDVDMLLRKLPNVKQSIRIEQLNNNLELVYANNIKSLVYDMLMKIMKNIDNNPDNNV